jgi:hypothetical protein
MPSLRNKTVFEQMGLKLEAQKLPVDVYVIEKVPGLYKINRAFSRPIPYLARQSFKVQRALASIRFCILAGTAVPGAFVNFDPGAFVL